MNMSQTKYRRRTYRRKSSRIKKLMGERIYELILDLDHSTFVKFIQGDYDNDEQFWTRLAHQVSFD